MKVKLPRLCCRHVINCQEMAVWNTLYVGHGDVSVKETRKIRILPLNHKQSLTFASPPPEQSVAFQVCGVWRCNQYVKLLPAIHKSNHQLLSGCCNPKQAGSTITSHLQSAHRQEERAE